MRSTDEEIDARGDAEDEALRAYSASLVVAVKSACGVILRVHADDRDAVHASLTVLRNAYAEAIARAVFANPSSQQPGRAIRAAGLGLEREVRDFLELFAEASGPWGS